MRLVPITIAITAATATTITILCLHAKILSFHNATEYANAEWSSYKSEVRNNKL